MRVLGLIGVLVLFTGCCGSLGTMATYMNERHVTGCVWGSGSYGPFVGVSALIATGGATIEDCRTMR